MLSGLARDIDDEVAVPHPRAAATAETDIVELAEGFLFLGGFVQRRSQDLAQQQLHADQDQAGNGRRARDPLCRYAGRPDHNQLTAARELTQAEERADERGDRQKLVRLLWKIEQGEPERVQRAVVPYSDVVLLIDENDQSAENEQHRLHEQHEAENAADDVAVENSHARLRRRFARNRGPWKNRMASNTTAMWVHHKPNTWGVFPCASQTLPAAIRFEYTK